MPGEKDRFDGPNCFIMTNPSQGRFYLYGNDPSEISIHDIAGAISRQCRFTGHLKDDLWYSVAEHCVLVADIVKELGGTKDEMFYGLMHDTPEAYLADIAAPFKREIGHYYDKEQLVWARIADKFHMPLELPPIVKKADWLALFLEAREFVVDDIETCHEWIGWKEHGEEAMQLQTCPDGMPHVTARELFMAAFNILGEGREG